MKSTLCAVTLAASLGAFACSSTGPTDNAGDVPADTSSEDLTAAAVDATLIANAEAAFNKAIYRADGTKIQITYSGLPGKLAKEVAKNNPDPKAEWADRAFATKVKNAHGVLTSVFMLMGGIDDEGESDTIFSAAGRALATGDTYRSDLPTWKTTAQ